MTSKPEPIRVESCPTCGRPADRRFRPFCSTRCAEVDLGRWLTGAYALPVADEDDEDDPAAPPLPGQAGRG